MTDWMMGGVNENDAEEARSERRWGPSYDDSDDRPSLSDLYEGLLHFADGEEPDESDGWEHPPWCTLPPFHTPYWVRRVRGELLVEMCEPAPTAHA